MDGVASNPQPPGPVVGLSTDCRMPVCLAGRLGDGCVMGHVIAFVPASGGVGATTLAAAAAVRAASAGRTAVIIDLDRLAGRLDVVLGRRTRAGLEVVGSRRRRRCRRRREPARRAAVDGRRVGARLRWWPWGRRRRWRGGRSQRWRGGRSALGAGRLAGAGLRRRHRAARRGRRPRARLSPRRAGAGGAGRPDRRRGGHDGRGGRTGGRRCCCPASAARGARRRAVGRLRCSAWRRAPGDGRGRDGSIGRAVAHCVLRAVQPRPSRPWSRGSCCAAIESRRTCTTS